MAGMSEVVTLAEAQEHYAAWLAADTQVSKGQAATVFGRSYQATDAATVTEKLEYWKNLILELKREASDGAGMQMMGGILGDV